MFLCDVAVQAASVSGASRSTPIPKTRGRPCCHPGSVLRQVWAESKLREARSPGLSFCTGEKTGYCLRGLHLGKRVAHSGSSFGWVGVEIVRVLEAAAPPPPPPQQWGQSVGLCVKKDRDWPCSSETPIGSGGGGGAAEDGTCPTVRCHSRGQLCAGREQTV